MTQLRDAAAALQRGDLAAAERGFATVLAAEPANVQALHLLGIVRAQQGRMAEAESLMARAVTADPRAADVRVNHGNVLNLLGRFDDAVAAYDAALKLNPMDAGTVNNRANALASLNRLEEALAGFDRALQLAPRHGEALYNRANTLLKLGQLEAAIAAFDGLLMVMPRHAGALNNKGIAQLELRRLDAALESFSRALMAAPDFVEAVNNRANVLTRLRRFDQALADHDRSLKLAPGRNEILRSRAGLLLSLKRHADALAAWRSLRTADPNDRYALGGMFAAALHLCDWDQMVQIGAQVEASLKGGGEDVIPPFLFLGFSGDKALQREAGRRATADRVPAGTAPLPPVAYNHDRIRIAYISSDYCQHPVPALIAHMLECHDRTTFEIHAISTGLDDGSAIRARIVKAVEHFHDALALGPAEIATLVRRHEIDILVDLNGHTEGDNLEVLARRPAPVQVNYLGYPATTGADFIDYILTDATVAPASDQAFFSEKIVELPNCYFPTAYPPLGAPPTRAEVGLPKDGFVFCCFNNSYKITPEIFAVWMRLLHQVPGSVLWLLSANADFHRQLQVRARESGIDPGRFVFASRVTAQQHLLRQQLAGLMLDTQPYTGHMTSSDALWAGVPIVTLPGTAFAGRVTARLLTALEVPDLIAPDLAGYEALALKLARDPVALKAVRDKIAKNRDTTAAFDMPRLARDVEAAFAKMLKQ